jgi:hypothetical protein
MAIVRILSYPEDAGQIREIVAAFKNVNFNPFDVKSEAVLPASFSKLNQDAIPAAGAALLLGSASMAISA